MYYITVDRDALRDGKPPVTVASQNVQLQAWSAIILGQSRVRFEPSGGALPRETKGRQVWVETEAPIIVTESMYEGFYQDRLLPGDLGWQS